MAEASHSERAKVLTGLALAAVAAGALVVSSITFFAVMLALLLVAAGEMFRLTRKLGVTPLPIVGFACVAACAALAYRGADQLLAGLPGIVAATTALTFVVLVVRSRLDNALAAVASTVAAAVYVGGLGSFVVAMRRMEHGFRVTLAFGLMTCLNVAAAHVVSRAAGRHPIAPSIDPGKTWEGLAAGAAATAAAGGIAAWQLNPPFTLSRAMVLAGLVIVVAPLGDFAEAALKRDARVKESGERLRGVLERIDAVLFAAPVFYLAYRAMMR